MPELVCNNKDVPVLRIVVDKRSWEVAIEIGRHRVRTRAGTRLLTRRTKSGQVGDSSAERSSREEMREIPLHWDHERIPIRFELRKLRARANCIPRVIARPESDVADGKTCIDVARKDAGQRRRQRCDVTRRRVLIAAETLQKLSVGVVGDANLSARCGTRDAAI